MPILATRIRAGAELALFLLLECEPEYASAVILHREINNPISLQEPLRIFSTRIRYPSKRNIAGKRYKLRSSSSKALHLTHLSLLPYLELPFPVEFFSFVPSHNHSLLRLHSEMAPATKLQAEDHSRDAAFNRAMHKDSADAVGGLRAMMKKDKTAQSAAVDEYFKHWDKSAKDETDADREVCSQIPRGTKTC